MKENRITKNDLKIWEESKDYFMLDLRSKYIKLGYPPTEEEAVNILGFLFSFTIGCSKMGLTSIAKKFSYRADLYAAGLSEMQYKSGWIANYIEKRSRGTLDRIIMKASYKANPYDEL